MDIADRIYLYKNKLSLFYGSLSKIEVEMIVQFWFR